MPYNTWDVTREILLTCFCVEFTQTAWAHDHWEAAGCQQTEQVSSRQSNKATANKEGTWLVQRLRIQLLVSWTFAHVAKNLCLTIKETLRQRTELVYVICFCFILFYFILFDKEACWYYIAVSPQVGFNHKGLETIYDMCVGPTMFFRSNSVFTHLWDLAALSFTAWSSTCQHMSHLGSDADFSTAYQGYTHPPKKPFLLQDMFYYCQCFHWALIQSIQ